MADDSQQKVIDLIVDQLGVDADNVTPEAILVAVTDDGLGALQSEVIPIFLVIVGLTSIVTLLANSSIRLSASLIFTESLNVT